MSQVTKTDNKPAGTRKGKPNRSSTTVRLAFHRMDFDAALEWVKTFRQLDSELANLPKNVIEAQQLRFAIIKEKLDKLNKAMDFVYPKITGMDLSVVDLVEFDEALDEVKKVGPKVEETSTEDLLKMMTQEPVDVSTKP